MVHSHLFRINIILTMCCIIKCVHGTFVSFLLNLPSKLEEAFRSTYDIIKRNFENTHVLPSRRNRNKVIATTTITPTTTSTIFLSTWKRLEIPILTSPKSMYFHLWKTSRTQSHVHNFEIHSQSMSTSAMNRLKVLSTTGLPRTTIKKQKRNNVISQTISRTFDSKKYRFNVLYKWELELF